MLDRARTIGAVVLLVSCQGGTNEVLRARDTRTAGSAGQGGMSSQISTAGLGGTATGGVGSTQAAGCEEPFSIAGTTTTGCIVWAAGFQFKVFPLEEGRPVDRLAVYFHTMGAGDWSDGSVFPDIVGWARARNIVVVAPLADNPRASWGMMSEADADFVGLGIEALRASFGTSSTRTLFWGTFDGSWFMSYAFIRQMGARLPGTYAMNCDGTGEPIDTFPWAWDYTNEEERTSISICFNYGSSDVMLPEIKADFDTYVSLGFAVTIRAYTTTSNCSHPVVESTLACWQATM